MPATTLRPAICGGSQQRHAVRLGGGQWIAARTRTLSQAPCRSRAKVSTPGLCWQYRLPPPAAGKDDPSPGDDVAGKPAQNVDQSDGSGVVGSVGLFLLWGALAAYAFLLSPNQTPLRDSYFLEKLVGLGVDDGVRMNTIVQHLFLIMGVWPLIYNALLIPSGKSGNNVPAWPFLVASYGVGAFGLLPYMALWQPPKQPPRVPPAVEDLQGFGNLMQKGMESPITAVLALAGAIWCLGQAAFAGAGEWRTYIQLFEESRFINVMSVDFCALTALAPFWMANDAALRKWQQRDTLVPILSLLPVVGPAIYLCLRPRAQT